MLYHKLHWGTTGGGRIFTRGPRPPGPPFEPPLVKRMYSVEVNRKRINESSEHYLGKITLRSVYFGGFWQDDLSDLCRHATKVLLISVRRCV